MKRIGVWLSLGCLVSGATGSLAPLGGTLHDNAVFVEWRSTATQPSGWHLEYAVQNHNQNRVRIVWRDPSGAYLYNSWLEQSSQPLVVATQDLDVKPEKWEGRIDVGTVVRDADLYQAPTVNAKRISTTSVLSLLLGGIIRRVSLKASSEYSNNAIHYALSLERAEGLESGALRFSWQAADSSAFREAASRASKDGLPFNLEYPLEFDVPTNREPRIRNGALEVWDRQGVFLGAASMPALVE